MKICIVSDIHMEIGGYPQIKDELEEGDVLIVAGDLTCARYFLPERTDADARKQKKAMDKFIANWTTKFKKTYYVMGNHEHYGFILPRSVGVLREYLKGTNITILDRDVEEFEGVKFVGASLWTNFNGPNYDFMRVVPHMMNDYRMIYRKHPDELSYSERHSSKQDVKYGMITPDYILERHEEDLEYIKIMTENPDKKTVVITHHCPSFKFNGNHSSGLEGAFCSDLEYFLEARPQINLWVCGHTHYNDDRMIWNTRVVSNCRGYFGYEDMARHFKPKYVEI